jgi:hypothetical protein
MGFDAAWAICATIHGAQAVAVGGEMSEEAKQALIEALEALSRQIEQLRPGTGWISSPAEHEIERLKRLLFVAEESQGEEFI